MEPTFVLAPDSFKESMTAKEVCMAMEKGLRQAYPMACYIHVPMADGGEGTMQSLVDATGGRVIHREVTGPLGQPVQASIGLLGDRPDTAVIEMSSASGIQLVRPQLRDPQVTTTYGTGELILACLDCGISHIIIGLGGSATNDGGAGMAQALGVKLLDQEGHELPHGGGALDRLRRIDTSELDPRLENLTIEIASDVKNPLCGPQGASHVFGKQKGGAPAILQKLDANLAYYAALIKRDTNHDVATIPGSGAAGGLGAGLLAFTDASIAPGIDLVIKYTHLEKYAAEADYVFTGEGSIDDQTQFGKTPFGVAKVAAKHGKPVIAVAGHVGEKIEELYDQGFTAIFSTVSGSMELAQALKRGPEAVARSSESIGRLIKKLRA
ncbi:glycerate kinase family protein [Sporolactobacillus inulinus]|uniref:Glycerate kinase n=1 Tax=Sporolactobacillus inulinus CASD TaxID=1069536 RepID=A0A0U1QKQ9_9BACL|nr:glycerate kinase [Sporolactobacillus inulinus CASD]GEB78399.1 glycerate kinase [Sporolactobacillus inulinus]